MKDTLLNILIPFVTTLFQVLCTALTIGMFPALWYIAKRRHFGLLFRWVIVALILGVGGGWGLYVARTAWKDRVGRKGFKQEPMWFGLFISVLTAPFLVPEPLRMARKRLRCERPPLEHGRKVRKKRRTEGFPPDLKLR